MFQRNVMAIAIAIVIAIAIAIVAGFPYSSQDDFSREARISSGFAQYLSEN